MHLFPLNQLCHALLPGLLLGAAAFAPAAEAHAQADRWMPLRREPVRAKTVSAADLLKARSIPAAAQEERRSLNGVWQGFAEPAAAAPHAKPEQAREPGAGWRAISVPNDILRDFPEAATPERPFLGVWYTREFPLSETDVQTRRIFLRFEAVAHEFELFINGRPAGAHFGSYTPFELEITKFVTAGANRITAFVRDDLGKFAATPFKLQHAYGAQWWKSLRAHGIYRNAALVLRPALRFDSPLLAPHLSDNAVALKTVLDRGDADCEGATLHVEILSAMAEQAGVSYGSAAQPIEKGTGRTLLSLTIPVAPETPRWDIGEPNLLYALLTVRAADGTVLAAHAERFGYREFRIRDGRFFLNGTQRYLFGQNTHAHNYEPTATSRERIEREADAEIRAFLRDGYNMVRTAHQPVNRLYLEAADEYGLPIMHEWAWSFSTNLDFDRFPADNLSEVGAFIRSSHNFPSVCAWSLGNEILLSADERLPALVDAQTRLVRMLDQQGRPVNTFSGAAGDFAGDAAPQTDILDFHDYVGLATPWGRIRDVQDEVIAKNSKRYTPEAMKRMPVIAFEMVGYSWGEREDRTFRPGDRKAYERYLANRISWGNPDIAGFLGSVPASIATQSGFVDWARNHYGRRIFEEMRLDSRFSGFAPWFSAAGDAPVWTQPVLPMLRNANRLAPRNLFAGETTEWIAHIANASPETLRKPVLELWLEPANGGEPAQVAALPLNDAPAHAVSETAVSFALPETVRGTCRLGLILKDGDSRLGSNWYDLFVQARAEIFAPVAAARAVCVLDCGNADNIRALTGLLAAYGLASRTVASAADAPDGALLIVPSDRSGRQRFFSAAEDVQAFLEKRGGTLLIFEPTDTSLAIPGGQMLFRGPSNMLNLTLPDHPVFEGLGEAQFDTWDNPDHGYVSTSFLSPFIAEQSLALKGPMLSSLSQFGNVVSEARVGSGTLLISLPEASVCFRTDSAAARYLRNLLVYATGSARDDRAASLHPAEADTPDLTSTPISIAAFANAGYADETAEDNLGGWTDQGDFCPKNIPSGTVKLGGIAFELLSPDNAAGNTCIRLRGEARPGFPEAVRDIPVGARYDGLAFLHTAAWCQRGLAAVYRIRYADGSAETFEVEAGAQIGDWLGAKDATQAPVALRFRVNDRLQGGAFLARWKNPHPDREIRAIDFLSAKAARAGDNAWEAVSDPVPILLAVSGITGGESVSASGGASALALTGDRFLRVSKTVQGGGAITETVAADGTREIGVTFDAHPADKTSFAIVFFKAARAPGGTARELVLEAKAAENTPLRLTLPAKGWSKQVIREVNVSGGNAWQTLRIDISDREINTAELLGELYLQHQPKDAGDTAPAATLSLRNIRVIAAASEKAPAAGSVDVLGDRFLRVSKTVQGGGAIAETVAADGTREIGVTFDAHPADKTSFAIVFFKAARAPGGTARELVLEAKAAENTPLRLTLPAKGWSKQVIREVNVSGGNAWQTLRIDISDRELNTAELLGELYLQHQPKDASDTAPAAILSIRKLFITSVADSASAAVLNKLPVDSVVSSVSAPCKTVAAGTATEVDVFGANFVCFARDVVGGGTVSSLPEDADKPAFEIAFAAQDGGRPPFAAACFHLLPAPAGTARELSFEARCATPAVLRIHLPAARGSRQAVADVPVPGGSDWKPLRIAIDKAALPFEALDGELYLSLLPPDGKAVAPATTLQIRNFRIR